MTLLSRHHSGNVGSSKEKRIWVIRGNEIKARRNSRRRPSLVRRKNEKIKEKRRTNKPFGTPPPLAVRLEKALPVLRLLDCDARLRVASAPCGRRGRPMGRHPRTKCHRSGTLPPPLRGGEWFDAMCAHGLRFAPPAATVLRPFGAGLVTGPFQGPSSYRCDRTKCRQLVWGQGITLRRNRR